MVRGTHAGDIILAFRAEGTAQEVLGERRARRLRLAFRGRDALNHLRRDFARAGFVFGMNENLPYAYLRIVDAVRNVMLLESLTDGKRLCKIPPGP